MKLAGNKNLSEQDSAAAELSNADEESSPESVFELTGATGATDASGSGTPGKVTKINGIEIDESARGDFKLLVYSKSANKFQYKDYSAPAAIVAEVSKARGAKSSLKERVDTFDLTAVSARKDTATTELAAARGQAASALKDRLATRDSNVTALTTELSDARNLSSATSHATLKARLDAFSTSVSTLSANAVSLSSELSDARNHQVTGTHTSLKARLDDLDVVLVGTYSSALTVNQDITTSAWDLWKGTGSAYGSLLEEIKNARTAKQTDGSTVGIYDTLEKAITSLVPTTGITQGKANVNLSGSNITLGGAASTSLFLNSATVTVSNAIACSVAPSAASHLTRKDYVDAKILAGGTYTGAIALGANALVTGASGTITAGETLTALSGLAITGGNSTLGGTAITVTAPVTFSGTNALSLASGTLTVGGASTLSGAVSFTSATVGAVSFTSAPTCTAVPGAANDIVNKTYVDGFALTKSQASNTVSGAVVLSGTSALTVGGNLSVAGTTTASGALSVLGGASFGNSTSVAGGVSVTGASGTLSVASTSAFTGVATFVALPQCGSDPSAANDLARKSYVDAKCLAGGTFTGSIVLAANALTATNGSISTTGTGNLETTGSGSIRTTGTGSITSATTVTAATGVTVTSGGLTVTAGGVTVTAGNITASNSTLALGGLTVSGSTTLQGALVMASGQSISLSGTGTITTASVPITMSHGTAYSAMSSGHVVTKSQADTQISPPQLELLALDVFS